MDKGLLEGKLLDIGVKIKFLRNLKGLTQYDLGTTIGLSARNAQTRIAQYEAGTRIPKQETLQSIADTLDVDILFLKSPLPKTVNEMMHLLFSLEDSFGMEIEMIDDVPYLRLIEFPDITNDPMIEYLKQWYDRKQMLKNKEVTKNEYNDWRWRYPKSTGYFGFDAYKVNTSEDDSDE